MSFIYSVETLERMAHDHENRVMDEMIALRMKTPDLEHTSEIDLIQLHIDSIPEIEKYKVLLGLIKSTTDAQEKRIITDEITMQLKNSKMYEEHLLNLRRTTEKFSSRYNFATMFSIWYSLQEFGKIYPAAEHYEIVKNTGRGEYGNKKIYPMVDKRIDAEAKQFMNRRLETFGDGNKSLALAKTREVFDSPSYRELLDLLDATTDACERMPINASITKELENSSMYVENLKAIRKSMRSLSQNQAYEVMVTSFYSLRKYGMIMDGCLFGMYSHHLIDSGASINYIMSSNKLLDDEVYTIFDIYDDYSYLNNTAEVFDDRTMSLALEHTRDTFDNLICGEKSKDSSYNEIKAVNQDYYVHKRDKDNRTPFGKYKALFRGVHV